MDDFQNTSNAPAATSSLNSPEEFGSTDNNVKPKVTPPENKTEKKPMVSKPFLILTIIIALLIVGVLVYSRFINKSSNDNLNDDLPSEEIINNQPSPLITQSAEENTTESEIKSGYSSYNKSELATAQNMKVVLFFSASWCPSCKELDLNIKNNLNSIPENIAILYVDYETNSELKSKYNVLYQHVLIQVDSSGNEIKRWEGSSTLQDLLKEIV